MATGIRQPGEFCWINMLTPSPAEAREFFGALFGWTFMEIPQGHIIKVGGQQVGGMFDLNGPGTPPGLPPVIGVMVKVENADATCQHVIHLGGTVKPAFDIGDQGRMAECFDPSGAEFDLWQPGRNPGADADSSAHGAPSWFEALTTDVGKTSRFYESLFGWTAEATPMGGFTYTVFKRGDVPVAGMMPILPEMGQVSPHWITYFTVDDVDAAVADAVSLGGSVVMPPQDAQGVGRFCGLQSPQGVMFWAIKYAN